MPYANSYEYAYEVALRWLTVVLKETLGPRSNTRQGRPGSNPPSSKGPKLIVEAVVHSGLVRVQDWRPQRMREGTPWELKPSAAHVDASRGQGGL